MYICVNSYQFTTLKGVTPISFLLFIFIPAIIILYNIPKSVVLLKHWSIFKTTSVIAYISGLRCNILFAWLPDSSIEQVDWHTSCGGWFLFLLRVSSSTWCMATKDSHILVARIEGIMVPGMCCSWKSQLFPSAGVHIFEMLNSSARESFRKTLIGMSSGNGIIPDSYNSYIIRGKNGRIYTVLL